MNRILGIFENEQRVEFRANPAWSDEQLEKARAGKLRPACHDGSPHAEFRCDRCDAVMHMHLTQIEATPPGAEIGSRCACGNVFVYDRDEAVRGLKEAWGVA